MNSVRCPLGPAVHRGAQKHKMAVFCLQVHFSRRKSGTKFLSVKTVSCKVVRHSVAYLSVQKWLMRDALLYVKIWLKLTNPLQKHRFPINIRL